MGQGEKVFRSRAYTTFWYKLQLDVAQISTICHSRSLSTTSEHSDRQFPQGTFRNFISWLSLARFMDGACLHKSMFLPRYDAGRDGLLAVCCHLWQRCLLLKFVIKLSPLHHWISRWKLKMWCLRFYFISRWQLCDQSMCTIKGMTKVILDVKAVINDACTHINYEPLDCLL